MHPTSRINIFRDEIDQVMVLAFLGLALVLFGVILFLA